MITKTLISLMVLAVIMAVGMSCAPGTIEGQQEHTTDTLLRGAQIDTLIAEASAASPEVSADLLIRIAESGLLKDKQKRIDLLDQAFRRSSGVQQEFRMRAWSGAVDTRTGYLSASYDLRLDALSLKSRAVKAMIALDPQRAAKLFGEIPKVKLSSLRCADILGYDVSDFYHAMQGIEEKGFSNEERKQGAGLWFVRSHVDEIDSPAQVGPVFSLIADSQFPAAELGMLVHSLSSALGKIQEDPRSFALSMRYGGLIGTFEHLVKICEDKDTPTSELYSSFRAYIVSQLRTVQCSDSLASSDRQSQKDDMASINKTFSESLTADEIRPGKVDVAAEKIDFWTTSASGRLLTKVKALRSGTGTKPLSVEERSTPEWQQNLMQLLSEIENWDGVSEKGETDFFHEKCNLYVALFALSPNQEARVRVLLSLAGYLRDSGIQEQSRIEWLLHMNDLFTRMRAVRGQERSEILGVFRNSGNKSLQLYADLDDVLSPTAR